MRLHRRAASAAIMFLAAGCALQPTYQRPGMPVAGAYPTGEAYKAPQGGETRPAAAIGWREFLADPRLRRLVELALQNNGDLRIAILNIEKVRAQYHVQRAGLFPQSNAGASAPRGNSPNAAQSFSVQLSASWEPDLFGRLHSMSDSAFQQYLASTYARQAAQILLVSQVADQYLTTLAFDEQLAVTRSTWETAQAAYKLVQLQYDNGIVSELDLRLAQTTVDQAQVNYAAQVRLRAQAENALVQLVGRPLPAGLPPGVKLDAQAILADIPAGLPSDLLQRRPDILQAEAVLRSENADIGAARAAFFPTITLTGALGATSSALGGLFSAGAGAWSFVPSLLAPIFNAGANQAKLDIAVVQKDIGIATYQKTVQAAFREVADGLAARGTYDDQLAAQQRNTEAQQRRLELATLRYNEGTDSYLSVLTAQTDLYNARQALVSARLNRLAGLVDLYRALGGGWIESQGKIG